MRRLAATATLLAALPLTAAAEGARLELACTVARSCTAEGQCAPGAAEPVRITLAPRDVDAGGAGLYDVVTGDVAAGAVALSFTGPFLWTDAAGDRRTLVIGTERTALLQHQPAADLAATRIDFLICEITA